MARILTLTEETPKIQNPRNFLIKIKQIKSFRSILMMVYLVLRVTAIS